MPKLTPLKLLKPTRLLLKRKKRGGNRSRRKRRGGSRSRIGWIRNVKGRGS